MLNNKQFKATNAIGKLETKNYEISNIFHLITHSGLQKKIDHVVETMDMNVKQMTKEILAHGGNKENPRRKRVVVAPKRNPGMSKRTTPKDNRAAAKAKGRKRAFSDTQTLFKKNPQRLVEKLLDGKEGERCSVDLEVI